MAYNYEFLPLRGDSYWVAGYDPNVIRFTFNANQIIPLDATTLGTRINILISGTPTGYSVGDVVYLDSPVTGKFYGTIVQIIPVVGAFTIIVEFNRTFSAPGATVWHGVRAGTYVEFTYINYDTTASFCTFVRKPDQYGVIDLDISGGARGQYDNTLGDYNFDVVNKLAANYEVFFNVVYTEKGELPITLPEIFRVVSAGKKLKRDNNFNSSNLIDFVPDGVTPAKFLNVWQKYGVPVLYTPGLPCCVDFIYPDTFSGLTFTTPGGTVTLDNTQAPGVNHLRITEAMFGSETEFCIDIEAIPFPSYYKELSFNFRFDSLNEFIYQLTEPMKAATFDGLFGVNVAGTGFWYGPSIAGLTAYPSFAAWKAAVATASAGDYIKINNAQSLPDGPCIITYGSFTPVTSPFTVALPFDQIAIGTDLTLPFRFEVAVQATISGCFAGLRTASAATEDWSLFTYDLSAPAGVGALNAAIAALAEPQDYVIHIWSETRTAKSISVAYTTALRQRISHQSEEFDIRYATGTQGLGSRYNGINQYNYITPGGFPQAKVDRGATFTVLCEFYFEPTSDSLLFTTSTWNAIPYVGFRIDLIGQTFNLGWQTGAGATLDLIRADVSLIPYSYNTVIAEFTGDTLTGVTMWINKRKAGNQVIFSNNVGAWSIANGTNDAAIAAYSVAVGASNLFIGDQRRLEFYEGTLTTEERERAFNKRTMRGIVPDVGFFFCPDLSVQPPVAESGTPAFTATNVGGVTNVIYLP